MTKKILTSAAALLLSSFPIFAGDPALSKRGKLLFSDDFSGATQPAPAWNGKVGNWEIAAGAAKVSEKPEDRHSAVRRHPVRYHDGVIEFSFKFDGSIKLALMLNEPGAHVCLLYITPTDISLDQGKTAKGEIDHAVLAKMDMPIATGKWHKAVLEVRGKRLIAQIDGGRTLAGESARIDVDKNDIGFLVEGVSAHLDNVQLYEIH